jgi:hypothetical protein
MESNTQKATWHFQGPHHVRVAKVTQIGSTPCHSAIRCMEFVIHVRICHVEDSTAKSAVTLHLTWHSGSGGCVDRRASVTTWQMATGLLRNAGSMDSGLHICYSYAAFSITAWAPFVPETILDTTKSLLYSVLCVCLLLGPGNITMGCWKLSLNLSHLMVTHFRFCSITPVATKVHGDIMEFCSVNMDA